MILLDLFGKARAVAARGKPHDAQLPRMRVDHRQGALADRSGGSEDGNTFHGVGIHFTNA